MSVGRDELIAAAEWMLGDQAEGDGSRFVEWVEARDVEIAELQRVGYEEADRSLEAMASLDPRRVRTVLAATFCQGFATGLEAERRRRDLASLPPVAPGTEGSGH
jgi:hypothetical protein